jgi:hypothetical protein
VLRVFPGGKNHAQGHPTHAPARDEKFPAKWAIRDQRVAREIGNSVLQIAIILLWPPVALANWRKRRHKFFNLGMEVLPRWVGPLREVQN